MEKADRCLRNRPIQIAALTATIAALSAGHLAMRERGWLQAASPFAEANGGAPPSFRSGDARGREAFLAAYKVFMHPRCMNCHPAGDVPLQGDDSHPHAQNVKRGPDGKGLYALKCANCHQLANLPGENMPPGNPNWHLTPPEMPMVFQGKSPAELARQLKDSKRNGGKTLEQLLHHVAEDKLVRGGWEPGEGRTKPPLTHAEFVEKMRYWVTNGADVPE